MRRRNSRCPEGGRSGRYGFTFVELLVSVLLSLSLAAGAFAMISFQSRAFTEMSATADRLDATRMVRGVLGSEIRDGRPDRDWRLLGSDSLSLRAFRGLGLPCGPPVDGTAVVLFRGSRGPEPVKDSVLVLRPDGKWRALDLREASPAPDSVEFGTGPCSVSARGGPLEEWVLDGLEGGFVLARVFEAGSYHLADAAFRYRVGAGGRQPLTPELLDDRRSDWRWSAPRSSLRLRLGFRDGRGASGEQSAVLWVLEP